MHRASAAWMLPVLLAAAAPAVIAQSSATPEVRDNVSITLVVGRSGGTAPTNERTYKLVGQDGKPARMLMGWRTPIPTRSSDSKESEGATSYIYQNIGMTADLQTQSVGKGRYMVSGQIEISGTREGTGVAAATAAAAATASGKPPLIGTFNQGLNVVVSTGKKIRIAESPDPEGGTLYLDLRVDILE